MKKHWVGGIFFLEKNKQAYPFMREERVVHCKYLEGQNYRG